MASSQPSGDDVEVVLAKRAAAHTKPSDEDLRPVYNFLRSTFIGERNEGSSSSASEPPHWYCSKTPSRLHREAATYLIFLFAFNRVERAQLWIKELEGVLRCCEKCARGFAAARRRFAAKYMSNFPSQVRTNFFTEVDRRQAEFIKRELHTAKPNSYGETSSPCTLDCSLLTPQLAQLLLGEPSLLENAEMAEIIDTTITRNPTSPTPSLTSQGLTSVMTRLLHSPLTARRKWAQSHLPLMSRQPLSFSDWCDLGIGGQIQAMYSEEGSDVPAEERWENLRSILSNGLLGENALNVGLLEGRLSMEERSKKGKPLMAVLSSRLGNPSTDFPTVFACFTTALRLCPNRQFWFFDTSPELPHTLFSDIKSNPSFQEMLSDSFSLESDATDTSKEEGRSWMINYLVSLTNCQGSSGNASTPDHISGFGEALARISSFCFSEMQHSRLDAGVRSAMAMAGIEALMALQSKVSRDHVLSTQLSATLDIHASFLASVALRPKDHPEPIWRTVRHAARTMLQIFMTADGRDIVESTVGLATVAYEERFRQRKLKGKKPAGPAVKVDKLRRAIVRRELWTTAYNNVLPDDPEGVAIFMCAVAAASHIELLDRQHSWKGDDLAESISREDWVDGIRAINAGIQGTRNNFSHAVESLSMQPNPELLERLWTIPEVPKAATILLLSSADNIHDPLIGLISQSFEADERGDCFRELLTRFPHQAVDGLCDFLSNFISIARFSPESCSLAKWLVRCFTDILDALCQPSASAEALLNSSAFLSTHANGKSMSRRLQDLWHLMTTSLAVIFKRTQAWAPLFENDVMIDWMRDAIIFGRQMTEHTRMFEAAVLGQSGSAFGADVSESPAKVTRAGKDLVSKLHIVLVDLVSWLRLTDVETLHQTFQLLKDILTRVSKTIPDLSKSSELERGLLELDKFCRKPTKSYTSRLTDDLLSELSELLAPFNLGIADDDVQIIKAVEAVSMASSSSPAREASSSRSEIRDKGKVPTRNAFDELMRGKGVRPGTSSVKASIPSRPSASAAKTGSSATPIDIDDFDDDFLGNMSTRDLELLEKRAQTAATTGKPMAGNISSARPSLQKPVVPNRQPAGHKLNINVVPKSTAPSGRTGFTSSIMRDLRKDHRHAIAERNRVPVGGIVPRLPGPSSAGTGLGAYQAPKPKPVQKPDSGSSASESSDDDDKGGLSQLIKKQKSPLKPAKTVHVPRSIQIIGNNATLEAMRKREDDRARKARMKARLKPDLNPLYRYVLGWDPAHTGPDPPHNEATRRILSSAITVPTSFNSAQRYEQIMLPLYLQELWMQALKGEGTVTPLPIEVTSRSYEDDFLDMEVAISGQVPERFSLNESDIVMLVQPGNPKKLFAKVQGYRRRFKDAGIKLRILQSMDQRDLGGKAKWLLYKHLSLSTALREFAALRGLPFYEPDLLGDILAGRSAALPKLQDSAVMKAMGVYEVNEPQAKAILGATSVEGFALIQGPPGTGKTKTISGLVGKWMSERPNSIAVAGEKAKKAKLLICAPSNAAIDEVCKRLMNGVPSAYGDRVQPNIVRIGVDSSVNDAVKDRSLDNLVEARVSTGMGGQAGGGEYARIQAELEEVKDSIRKKQEQIRNLSHNDEGRNIVEAEYHTLMNRRTQLGQSASKAKDAARDATRHLEGARRAAKEAILEEADIVCATLSGAGQEVLSAYEFETVIIDEAAQAIEMSCLIPLKYGCKRCIMVGDPNQLPPTTFSTDAERFHYNESLFVRMARANPQNMHLLSIQYRMHPYISELPSKVFYQSQLKDGPDMAAKTAAIWHSRHIFGSYRFFNVNGTELKAGTSTKNPDEAKTAVALYRRLEEDFGNKIDLALRIGVITMYKEQLFELKRAFNQAFGPAILSTIEFNTVDGFQGQEKDIIILSCVRSGPNLNSIGFLKDARRINVALTRAKSSLFVIGNAATLERGDERWKTIVQDARTRGFVIDCNGTTFAAGAPSPLPKKEVKKERAMKPETKPLLVKGHIKPSATTAAAATPVKRKSLGPPIADIKRIKAESKPATVSRSDSSSSSSSSSSSDSDAPTPPAKKAKITAEPSAKSAPTINSTSKPITPGIVNSSSSTSVRISQPPPPRQQLPPKTVAPPPPINPASVAFIKKKKKPIQPGNNVPVAAPALGTTRQQLNDLYGSTRRP